MARHFRKFTWQSDTHDVLTRRQIIPSRVVFDPPPVPADLRFFDLPQGSGSGGGARTLDHQPGKGCYLKSALQACRKWRRAMAGINGYATGGHGR